MRHEHDIPASVRFVLTAGNLAAAVVALTAFGSWQARDRSVLTPSQPVSPLPQQTVLSGPGPTLYFVASQEEADAVEEFFVTNAVLVHPKARVKVMVIRSPYQEHKARQAIAEANKRRAATGRPAIHIIDVRPATVSSPVAEPWNSD